MISVAANGREYVHRGPETSLDPLCEGQQAVRDQAGPELLQLLSGR